MPHGIDARRHARFPDGDPDAVLVYLACGRLEYAIARAIVAQAGRWNEANPQTFLKAWRTASHVHSERGLRPRLTTIAERVSIDIYRWETCRATGPLGAVPADDPVLAA
ncbi:MAG: hypothetical protein JO262_23865 [Solirubrobacterales bacterium]|nr:hypothetical protein [Solirubrobacterales bacterium]